MIGARVGARNRLHGEVTNQDVADAIREEIGVEIDRHKIEIERPIRSLGMFMLPVRIAKGLEASITVEILEESGVGRPPGSRTRRGIRRGRRGNRGRG